MLDEVAVYFFHYLQTELSQNSLVFFFVRRHFELILLRITQHILDN